LHLQDGFGRPLPLPGMEVVQIEKEKNEKKNMRATEEGTENATICHFL
jgi:hypothetical protein